MISNLRSGRQWADDAGQGERIKIDFNTTRLDRWRSGFDLRGFGRPRHGGLYHRRGWGQPNLDWRDINTGLAKLFKAERRLLDQATHI